MLQTFHNYYFKNKRVKFLHTQLFIIACEYEWKGRSYTHVASLSIREIHIKYTD